MALAALNTASASRRVKPKGDLAAVLRSALRSDQAELSEQALGLIGQWRVADLHDDVASLVDDNQSVGVIRLAAVRALGLLGGDDTKRLAKLIDSGDSTEELKLAALDSLSRLSMSTAADHGARLLVGGVDSAGILAPFLKREGGGRALTVALAKRKLEAGPAAAALAKLQSEGLLESDPVVSPVAAVSVGVVGGVPMLDLPYVEDVAAEVDMNLVMNGQGEFIELQGTGEKNTFSDTELATMLAHGRKGIGELLDLQQAAIAEG